MKACMGNLWHLTRDELEALAAGEIDAPECEVEGAQLILSTLAEQEKRACEQSRG